MTSRREFIRTGCVACLGIAGAAAFLESCAAGFPMVRARGDDGKVLRVAESQFGQPGGMLIVRSDAIESDILLRRDESGAYLALYLHCTHGDVALTPTRGKLYCNAHGSVFDLDGKVVKEPARRPLRRFGTAVENNEILIYLN